MTSERGDHSTEENDTETESEILHEWVEQHDLYTRDRYRIVKSDGEKMLYRLRELKEDGEWVAEPSGISIPEDASTEEIPDFILNGWTDVPAEFKEVDPDADW